ncbi:ubiquinone/menaquinone biosynthesis C-methyltransferase UbiE-like isoform X1 [Clavelina lepadiformis]|uniref:ubiquinone/menaquinone biosynthesis C-methyltransferase UbiE-like isoform X1 n=1 Tax=Clavelina lepadiformis TaxID=159417 RepID=UPI0040413280
MIGVSWNPARIGKKAHKMETCFDKAKKAIFCRSPEESQKNYSEWSSTYDNSLSGTYVFGVLKSYENCGKYAKEVSSILDVGAGTGRLGGHLRNHHGYEGTLDILDANMDLLMQAEKKGLNIRNIIRHAVTESGELPVQDESYDMITCIGAFLPNHIPATALPGIIKAVKRGGLIVVEMRKTTIDEYRAIFDANLQMLLDQSELRIIYEEDYFPYKNFDTSPIFTAFVFKRL